MNIVKKTLLIVSCMLFASMPLKAEWSFTKIATLVVLVSAATTYGVKKAYDVFYKKNNRRKHTSELEEVDSVASSLSVAKSRTPAYEIDPRYNALPEDDLAFFNRDATSFARDRALGISDKYVLFQ